MKGLDDPTGRRCRESLSPARRAAPAIAVLLARFLTGLPPELIERPRSAARAVGLPESLIAADANALFLGGEGF